MTKLPPIKTGQSQTPPTDSPKSPARRTEDAAIDRTEQARPQSPSRGHLSGPQPPQPTSPKQHPAVVTLDEARAFSRDQVIEAWHKGAVLEPTNRMPSKGLQPPSPRHWEEMDENSDSVAIADFSTDELLVLWARGVPLELNVGGYQTRRGYLTDYEFNAMQDRPKALPVVVLGPLESYPLNDLSSESSGSPRSVEHNSELLPEDVAPNSPQKSDYDASSYESALSHQGVDLESIEDSDLIDDASHSSTPTPSVAPQQPVRPTEDVLNYEPQQIPGSPTIYGADSTASASRRGDGHSVANLLVAQYQPENAHSENEEGGSSRVSFLVPKDYDRSAGVPPATVSRYRETTPNVTLGTSKVTFGLVLLKQLDLVPKKKGSTTADLNLNSPVLASAFYKAPLKFRENAMEAMSTVKVSVRFKDNLVPSDLWNRIKHKIKGPFDIHKFRVRGDVAFMLQMSHDKDHGRFFGAAISAARPTAIDDLLAITKTSRFLTSGVLLDATLEIAEVVALESPTYPQSSLDAAGNLVCAYITAADADKTIARDGKVLAEIINTVAGKKTSDLRLRGVLVGIYISGAYKFSVAATKRDEESIKRYKQFNGLLWDSLNSITFPGVAAVTAILKTASEELISKAFVPRDFRSQLVQRLGKIKWAIEKDFEKTIKTDDVIEGERFLNGRVMEWIDIAMACNGVL